MFKRKSLLILAVLTSLILMSGCSQSDRNSTSEEVKADQEAVVINGYTLPPEPDPAINNSTLLGVDSNNNGVRDDVERWIYKKFSQDQKYPKTKTAIAMQFAAAQQYIMANDPEHAYENKTYKKVDYALDCQWYWFDRITKNMGYSDGLQFRIGNEIYDNEFREKLFNTKDRLRAYFYYNSSLSGHMLGGGGGVLSSTKEKCKFDIEAFGEL